MEHIPFPHFAIAKKYVLYFCLPGNMLYQNGNGLKDKIKRKQRLLLPT